MPFSRDSDKGDISTLPKYDILTLLPHGRNMHVHGSIERALPPMTWMASPAGSATVDIAVSMDSLLDDSRPGRRSNVQWWLRNSAGDCTSTRLSREKAAGQARCQNNQGLLPPW